jgi:hypothetical protein
VVATPKSILEEFCVSAKIFVVPAVEIYGKPKNSEAITKIIQNERRR